MLAAGKELDAAALDLTSDTAPFRKNHSQYSHNHKLPSAFSVASEEMWKAREVISDPYWQ